MSHIMYFLLILVHSKIENVIGCTWPEVDALFILDSTPQVTSFQHRTEVDFIRQVMSTMKMSSSKVAMAQFTPWSRVEWSLANSTYPESKVQEAPYCPCEQDNCPSTSINALTRYTMNLANRKSVPDVILVISNSYQPLVEVLPNEPLISPVSPLHVFYVVIGSNLHVSRFEPSAHTVGMKVTDFEHLPHLVLPLCQSVNGYIKVHNAAVLRESIPLSWVPMSAIVKREAFRFDHHVYLYELCFLLRLVFSLKIKPQALWMSKIIADVSWWNFLNWNSTSCHRQNAEQTVFWTVPCGSSTRFGPLCWIIIGAILFFAIILVALLAYAIYNYNEENRRLRHRIAESERLLRKQNEYFTSQLHTEMQKQITNGEKHAEEMKKQQDMMQSQFDRQLDMAYQQGSKIQILPPFNQFPLHDHHSDHIGKESIHRVHQRRGKDRRDSGIASPRSPRDVEVQVTPIPTPVDNKKTESEEDNKSSGTSTESILDSGSDVTESTEEDLEELNRKTHLPRDHPARKLPPIDLMFLVDTSSSIGINNFDIQKNFICEILKDVDIAPGRSRISMVQYAQDPSVVFGFDQYYSFESVRRGVMRLSYTGGATMLSKALAFAGGIMYHEQNLKKTTKRHQFLPTPKHDRLQVLCLVSDGYSDDNADKESVNLHDRLHVKIFAVVTRSFNKDKLVPITRFDGSVFTVHQRESVAIWLWRQQRIWAEHYSAFIEKEKKRSARRQDH